MKLIYDNIIGTLMSEDIGKYVPEGMAHSFPIIGKENGRIIDCFFLFSYSHEKTRHNAPIARLAIDASSGDLVYYKDTQTIPTEANNETRSYPLEFTHSKDERRNAMQQYQDTYVLVREFAFANNLGSSEYDVLLNYMDAFEKLIPSNQKPFYYEISPAFFEWVETMKNS